MRSCSGGRCVLRRLRDGSSRMALCVHVQLCVCPGTGSRACYTTMLASDTPERERILLLPLCCLQVFMTFLLVMTVYAAAVAKPGHGNTAPLAIGLSLYAAALTGE